MKGQVCLGDVNTKSECGIYLEMTVLNSDTEKACRGRGVDLKAESSMHLYSWLLGKLKQEE